MNTHAKPKTAKSLTTVWMSIASVLIAINLFLILTLLQMAPQLKIIAQILTTPMNSSQFIFAESLSEDLSDKKIIEEMFIRYYLTERYIILQDENEMKFKWSPLGPIAQLSLPTVYSKFYQGLGELPKNLRNVSYTQNIDIKNVSRINNIWTVEFDVYRLTNGIRTKTTRIARLTTSESPNYKYYRIDSSNPYGFVIIEYDDAAKR